MPAITEYVDSKGRNHYAEFFNDLPAVAAAKVTVAVVRMETGHSSGLKSLGAGLAEWRIDWGKGIRIYVHQDGDELIVLMGGGDKSDQSKEIEKAIDLVKEYKQRKKQSKEATKKATTVKRKNKK
ncbi:type II toxin-antitoxin system RelE/ParE family toxin [Dyella flagellata]|uniref:Addiction module killer protein n=1 Tax=Dyella flagellata TaxID=1867833 RepID=A0ABQ5X9C5_9GAMM|nr:type II toxin-antitoxin system RelE/ParE family toxin [Dyella flagellata]GLQ88270.1 hypothetical protein GCM10007898_18390 [Dyella flagellata]